MIEVIKIINNLIHNIFKHHTCDDASSPFQQTRLFFSIHFINKYVQFIYVIRIWSLLKKKNFLNQRNRGWFFFFFSKKACFVFLFPQPWSRKSFILSRTVGVLFSIHLDYWGCRQQQQHTQIITSSTVDGSPPSQMSRLLVTCRHSNMHMGSGRVETQLQTAIGIGFE